MDDVETRSLEYHDADGRRYVGYIARPARSVGSAVLIAHNAPGVTDFERRVALQLAKIGHIAFCADYIGNGEVLATDVLTRRIAPLLADPSMVRTPMQAALATLLLEDDVVASRVAAIGYCFGGAAAFELACSGADLACVVGFHSSLSINRPQDMRAIRGKVLIQQGSDDPLVPTDVRATFEAHMNAAGVDWQMHLYGCTGHAFSVAGSDAMGIPGVAYQPTAARRSWLSMLNLFAETIDRTGDIR